MFKIIILYVVGQMALICAQTYSAFDDMSWAVTSKNLSDSFGDKQLLYDTFISDCENARIEKKDIDSQSCANQDHHRLRMNRLQPKSVYNYTTSGFKKIRVPDELFSIIYGFYEKNKEKSRVEWEKINTYHNMWDSPPSICLMNSKKFGGSRDLQQQVFDQARPILEAWTGQRLKPVSLYGVRTYYNKSILTPHVDRFPLVSSAIINVAQEVDEPWPLEVYGHDGKAHNITMEPGDMVLYESHSVVHGRPYPFHGKYYANIFLHFEPMGPLGTEEARIAEEEGADRPPYLVQGSIWEGDWKASNPNGWRKKSSPRRSLTPHQAAQAGNKDVIEKLAKTGKDAVHYPDPNGWYPLHEAIRGGHTHIVELLLDAGADKNQMTRSKWTPLFISRRYLGEDHPVTVMLIGKGAIDMGSEL